MGLQQNTHGAASGDVNLQPDQAKLAAGLIRDFVGDNIPEDTEVNGQGVGQDAYEELLDALDAVANQA